MSKRTLLMLAMTVALLAVAPLVNPAWAAEDAAEAAGGGAGMIVLALAIAAGACGLGQAWAISSSVNGIARNPGAGGAIRLAMLLGLAFIESLVIYVLVIAFLQG